ncbi:MAG: D-alanine--D-alanine ligase family protein [Christensenellales bacterium]|nr:D-alanine--D-alanine ligase [Christensenellaceae bacterium]MBS5571922.1 D-alanine--D-alanine ligase [Clostridiales bacterium]MEE1441212.1 D-alanine--D-alanine ligase family protein [Christensenellales bacterium]HIR81307.1 D-alanine--D-alanine ligase [Candidatus Limiplasma merdipullorum]
MSKIQLGVMFGSRSCEHEVSIISAVQLMRAADRQIYDVIPIYISKKGEWFTGDALLEISAYTPFDESRKGVVRVNLDITAGSGALTRLEHGKGLLGKDREVIVARLDCVIPVFHGMHGEDGTIQGLLELCNIPYASSGVGASAMGMDKVYMKQFFRGAGYPVLPSCWFLRRVWDEDPRAVMDQIEKELSYPVFVKPASLGSSIGVSKAKDRAALEEALKLAFEFDRKVLVEKGLDDPLELNCSVLGYDGKAQASEIEMPVSGGELLTFMDKYMAGSSTKGMASLKRVLPAPIEPELRDKIRALSLDIFNDMDCKGVVRIDYMYDAASDGLYITEINTIPGSLAFYLWEAGGMPYSRLIDEMVRCAMEAQKDKDDSNYAYSSDILSNISLGGKAGSKAGLKNA